MQRDGGMAHVLIIEDDRDIREALTDALELEGHEVACRQEQKRDASIRDVPVVVVSALRNQELDVAAYVHKPCSLDDVLGAVQHVGSSPA